MVGATVTVLGNTGSLVKTGYAFAGWNTTTDGNGTTYAASATFSISANITLYALWTPTYIVTYNANGATGGSVPTDSNNYFQGNTVTVLGNTGALLRTNYTFIGWNTAANGSGTTYTQSQTFSMGNSNVTLYAVWTANPTYTVTYNANGATNGTVPADPNNYLQSAQVTVLGNTGTLIRTGFTFAGWNTAANGTGVTYAAGTTFTISTSNVTLYAVWTAAPTYVFGGWNTQADGKGTTYAPGATFTITSNVILYAVWTLAGSNFERRPDNSGGSYLDQPARICFLLPLIDAYWKPNELFMDKRRAEG
jgi:uncharacterized repeat protein (TIGR02543 family)